MVIDIILIDTTMCFKILNLSSASRQDFTYESLFLVFDGKSEDWVTVYAVPCGSDLLVLNVAVSLFLSVTEPPLVYGPCNSECGASFRGLRAKEDSL